MIIFNDDMQFVNSVYGSSNNLSPAMKSYGILTLFKMILLNAMNQDANKNKFICNICILNFALCEEGPHKSRESHMNIQWLPMMQPGTRITILVLRYIMQVMSESA